MPRELSDSGVNEPQGETYRLNSIDVARGAAIAGVVLFHIVWNLEFFGFISGIAFHPIWLGFGRVLAGTFMLLVGVSLVLAHTKGFRAKAFLRRLGVVCIAAATITLVTWFLFPDTFIYFGILHAIAVASVIGALLLRLPVGLTLLAGIVVLALPIFFNSPIFETRWVAWIGLFVTPPPSNDFVPLFPWAGLTLLGIAFAKLVRPGPHQDPIRSRTSNSRLINSLAWMGKNSLSIYLFHQPVLFSVIFSAARLF